MAKEDVNKDPLPEKGGDKTEPENLSLKQLEETLGKKFPDKETALKSIKDTYNYVGKAGKAVSAMEAFQKEHGLTEDETLSVFKEAAIKTATSDKIEKKEESNFVTKDVLERMSFYNDNPEYKEHSDLIDQLKKANSEKSYKEIVETKSFKTIFEKAKAQDDAEKKKSVLRSSSKLGEVKDLISEARKAQYEGRQTEANSKAVQSVIDAFHLRDKS